ncbi:hypothetical protein I302_103280 [Kwoniella bestiolae CBS 10118]|uniref:Uncharacterized protein n=1 Tax=Kwoniella bestiolae CBS 10118 TaxID=1296100 RepID=A0A1B9G7Y1_9TREE|nr:hypothetical protein I302_01979 [Kwoniella bestiolae CBS 10118]OCF27144.1 hypothetical protein I302_01979 [Kwoniella bestiolae CBS 10118]
MEADRVSHEVRNVAERLISLEPDQYGNALDQYFEDNVVYESRGIHLQGLNEFKKYLNLGSVISFDSHLVGHTHYDEHNKIAKFAFSRTIYLPTLPTWVPASDSINKFLNKQHFRPIFDTELHLTAKGQRGNEGIRYVVSQVGPTERRDATFIEKALPYLLLRPLVTFLVLILANVTGFFQRHSYKEENPVNLALSAVAESWASVRGHSIDREHYPETIKQAQKLSEKIGQAVTTTLDFTTSTAHKATDQARSIGLPVDQTQHLIEMGLHVPTAALHTAGNVTLSALHTAVVIEQASVSAVQSLALNAIGIASGTAHVVEDQAKDLGLPVDEYRELAFKRAHDVGEWFGVIKAKAEEQGRRGIQAAQLTAQQVEDATRQGIRQAGETTQRVAEQGIDIAREAVEQGANATQRAARVVKKEAGPTADKAKGVVEEVTPGGDVSNTKTNTDQGGENAIPRLSSGGHDPNAAGAPSYAAAAH